MKQHLLVCLVVVLSFLGIKGKTSAGSISLEWPVSSEGRIVRQKYFYNTKADNHLAIDISGSDHTIYAAQGGVVVQVGWPQSTYSCFLVGPNGEIEVTTKEYDWENPKEGWTASSVCGGYRPFIRKSVLVKIMDCCNGGSITIYVWFNIRRGVVYATPLLLIKAMR